VAPLQAGVQFRGGAPDNQGMHPTSNPRHVADQMVMADRILCAFANGAMPMHADGYRELASWVTASFCALSSDALRGLREVAPDELREIVENVLHERQVVSWAYDDLVGLSSLAGCVTLLRRCRQRRAA
jgi:hypothetical protein